MKKKNRRLSREELQYVIAENIKYYREKKHLTQEELSFIIEKKADYIKRYENHKIKKMLSVEDLYKLTTALNIEPEKLLIKK